MLFRVYQAQTVINIDRDCNWYRSHEYGLFTWKFVMPVLVRLLVSRFKRMPKRHSAGQAGEILFILKVHVELPIGEKACSSSPCSCDMCFSKQYNHSEVHS